MTTKAASEYHDISVNLENETELNILTWRLDVQAIASNLATVVTPTGLLTHVLTNRSGRIISPIEPRLQMARSLWQPALTRLDMCLLSPG